MEGGLVRARSMHAARDEFSRFVVAQHDFYYSTATCDFRFKHDAGERSRPRQTYAITNSPPFFFSSSMASRSARMAHST
jgi:hypothetical protein